MKKFIALLIPYPEEKKKKKTQRLATLQTSEAFQPQRCDAVQLWLFPHKKGLRRARIHTSVTMAIHPLFW